MKDDFDWLLFVHKNMKNCDNTISVNSLSAKTMMKWTSDCAIMHRPESKTYRCVCVSGWSRSAGRSVSADGGAVITTAAADGGRSALAGARGETTGTHHSFTLHSSFSYSFGYSSPILLPFSSNASLCTFFPLLFSPLHHESSWCLCIAAAITR